MSFDIYGNNLLRGHCEVHPYVHEPYPCSVCFRDADEQKRMREQEYEHYRALEIEQSLMMEAEYKEHRKVAMLEEMFDELKEFVADA